MSGRFEPAREQIQPPISLIHRSPGNHAECRPGIAFLAVQARAPFALTLELSCAHRLRALPTIRVRQRRQVVFDERGQSVASLRPG